MRRDDPDVDELACYFAMKAPTAVGTAVDGVDVLIARAQDLVDRLESNNALGNRCVSRRCARNRRMRHARPFGSYYCRACKAWQTALLLVRQLTALRDERRTAAALAGSDRDAYRDEQLRRWESDQ